MNTLNLWVEDETALKTFGLKDLSSTRWSPYGIDRIYTG
jgi:hypothetical protein